MKLDLKQEKTPIFEKIFWLEAKQGFLRKKYFDLKLTWSRRQHLEKIYFDLKQSWLEAGKNMVREQIFTWSTEVKQEDGHGRSVSFEMKLGTKLDNKNQNVLGGET